MRRCDISWSIADTRCPMILISGIDLRRRCHKLPLRGPLLRHLHEGGHTGVMNARTNTTRRMCGSIRARMCS